MEIIGETVLYEGSLYSTTGDFSCGVQKVVFKKKVQLGNGEERYLFSDAFSSRPFLFEQLFTGEQVKRCILPNKPI